MIRYNKASETKHEILYIQGVNLIKAACSNEARHKIISKSEFPLNLCDVYILRIPRRGVE